jgi:hypothetical protein|tara:strand:+ start:569 stop:877 length:309 start_codon:yes stop_codon:yes gene_type:complete
MKATVNCSRPRLSDEEMDPIELDDIDTIVNNQTEGWLPWDMDDILDIKKIINEKMPKKQQEIMLAFFLGMSYNEIGVSEKHWRYHYQKAIEFIQKELKIWPA